MYWGGCISRNASFDKELLNATNILLRHCSKEHSDIKYLEMITIITFLPLIMESLDSTKHFSRYIVFNFYNLKKYLVCHGDHRLPTVSAVIPADVSKEENPTSN